MATKTAAVPTAEQILGAYELPVEEAAGVRRAFEAYRAAAASLTRLEAAVARVDGARTSGGIAELRDALATAPDQREVEVARADVEMARRALDEARIAERQRREESFHAYARGEVARLLGDLDRVLARNAEFSRVCARRHDAVSGASAYTPDNPSLPRLAAFVEAVRDGLKHEYEID